MYNINIRYTRRKSENIIHGRSVYIIFYYVLYDSFMHYNAVHIKYTDLTQTVSANGDPMTTTH